MIIQDDAKSRHALGQHPRRHNDQGQPNQCHWRESVRHSWCMDQLPAKISQANQLSQANPNQYRWQLSPQNLTAFPWKKWWLENNFSIGKGTFLVTMLKLREGNPTYFFNNGQLVLSDLDWHLLTLFAGGTFQFQAKKNRVCWRLST